MIHSMKNHPLCSRCVTALKSIAQNGNRESRMAATGRNCRHESICLAFITKIDFHLRAQMEFEVWGEEHWWGVGGKISGVNLKFA